MRGPCLLVTFKLNRGGGASSARDESAQALTARMSVIPPDLQPVRALRGSGKDPSRISMSKRVWRPDAIE